MTGTMNDYMKTIRYQYPEKLLVSVSFLPATWARYGGALNGIRARYPEVFGDESAHPIIEYYAPPSYHAGAFTDEWGCVWSNIREGYESIVTGHPLPEREMVNALKAPEADIGLPHGFMFLRLLDLRGFEEMMIDFAEEPPELQRLIDIVCEYNVRQMRLLCERTSDEVVSVGDDNGIQKSLPIRPETWRKYLKPAYAAIFGEAHRHGKAVYFHTDGCIHQVMPDMHEVGADIINPQIGANGLDALVRVCKGKIPICLDLDRQMFPWATPEQIKTHITECARALYLPQGGLMLSAECAADVPLENIEAICETLARLTTYKGD